MVSLTDLLFKSPATGVAAMVIAPLAGAEFAHWYSNVLSGRADSLIPSLQVEARELGALDAEVQEYWQGIFPGSRAPSWYSVGAVCFAIDAPSLDFGNTVSDMCSANKARSSQSLKVADLTRKVENAEAEARKFDIIKWIAAGFAAIGVFGWKCTYNSVLKAEWEAAAARKEQEHPRQHL